MTNEWGVQDPESVLRRRRRELVGRSAMIFVFGAALLVARALAGQSLLFFGLVLFGSYACAFAFQVRPLWLRRARERWTSKVLDDAVVGQALVTRAQVPPELHERVSARAQAIVGEATLSLAVVPILIVVMVGWALSEWAHSPVWWIAGGLGAVVAIAVGVVRTNRRAQPARRWLAEPPAPLLPDDAAHAR